MKTEQLLKEIKEQMQQDMLCMLESFGINDEELRDAACQIIIDNLNKTKNK